VVDLDDGARDQVAFVERVDGAVDQLVELLIGRNVFMSMTEGFLISLKRSPFKNFGDPSS
jgi:hypothetical protein